MWFLGTLCRTVFLKSGLIFAKIVIYWYVLVDITTKKIFVCRWPRSESGWSTRTSSQMFQLLSSGQVLVVFGLDSKQFPSLMPDFLKIQNQFVALLTIPVDLKNYHQYQIIKTSFLVSGFTQYISLNFQSVAKIK